MKKSITTLYYLVDDFCKIFNSWEKANLLPTNKIRYRTVNLSLAELLTTVLYFYLSPCKDFKNYYLYFLSTFSYTEPRSLSCLLNKKIDQLYKYLTFIIDRKS